MSPNPPVAGAWRSPALLPGNPHDDRLAESVHPLGHSNPEPKSRYHLVVVGGGTAGLVSAFGAAGLGARVALVERDLLGGDCLNTGCVPSKAVIHGATHPEGRDFGEVMERVRAVRADIGRHDSVSRLEEAGIDVFLGSAAFTGPDRLEVGGATIRFKRAIVATGASAWVPPIEGFADVPHHTHETFFNQVERPDRLLVIGGGPIGSEMAQSFARLGARVTVLDVAPRILGGDDPEAAEVVRAQMERDGVHFVLGATITKARKRDDDIVLSWERGEETGEAVGDEVLVATGRRANVSGLGLEAAGVEFDGRGIVVDDRLRSTNKRIYAAGDVASSFKFTHAADALARIAIRNALFFGRAKASSLTVPWATYTDPEVAHVGLSPQQIAAADLAVDTFTVPFADVDRAKTDEDTRGFARVHVRRGTDKIVGGTIVGSHAADLIGGLSLAMTHGLGLGALSRTVHPYPSRGEVLRKLGDAHARTRLTPGVAALLRRWFSLWG